MGGSLRPSTLGVVAVLTASLIPPAGAVVQPKGHEGPIVSASRAPRVHRDVRWSRASQLAAFGLPGFTAMWDADTDVPLRLWGPGVAAPGAVRDGAIAEAAARRFLATHLALLAPGARVGDFELVSNQLGGSKDVRSLGFVQRAGGVPVLGGAIGMSFKADRLVMIGSTALPDVSVAATPRPLPVARVTEAAIAWLAEDGHVVRATTAPRRVIVPVVRPRTTRGKDVSFHVADEITVEANGGPGRWTVWIDAASGTPIARRSTIHYASGRVLFDVPDRSPTGTRSPKPASQAAHVVNGVPGMSALDGMISWAAGLATITPSLRGPLISVTNKAGALATDTLTLEDGGDAVWSKPTEELVDAQLSAFVFASQAKAYSREHFDAELGWLDDTLSVSVNENGSCNAYSTGDDIHFLKLKWSDNPIAGTSCQNTARIADVVYHEFGHSLHAQGLIEGVGNFDGALSEGLGDILAMHITNDHGMARGFFFTDEPLRDLNPQIDKRWGVHTTGEVHDDGEIIGGTMWDLRTALHAKHGVEAGEAISLKIFYGILQRATDIPSSYAEALVSDDDDGDLSNGTPNQCEINTAFGAHGLLDPELTLGLSGVLVEGRTVKLATRPSTSSSCPGPSIASASIDWKPRGGTMQRVELALDGTTYVGELPEQPYGTVVQYKVTVTLSDNATITYPDNAGDPLYEMYVGEVEKVWCADFEDGGAGWTHGANQDTRNEWQIGEPRGLGGDPKTAHGGINVLGQDLGNDGLYRRNTETWAQSPDIDVSAHAGAAMRLQYYRWLQTEDGYFDPAKLLVNGEAVWNSYTSPSEPSTGVHHMDREWRFQDVDVSRFVDSGKLSLRFEHVSDRGFGLGGWTVDDVCIVIAKPAPDPCADEGACKEPVKDNGFCAAGGSRSSLLVVLGALGLVARRRKRRAR